MRKAALLLAMAAAGCQEPPKTGQYESAVRGLADLHTWDPGMQAQGQYAYDVVVGSVPDVFPVLVSHLTDETPTAIYEKAFGIQVTISDVCFMILLRVTGMNPEIFYEDGVFVSKLLPNPIFCVRWNDRPSRYRVQARFTKLLKLDEEKK